MCININNNNNENVIVIILMCESNEIMKIILM